MELITIATTLGLLLLTKATESAGEKLGEELVNKAGEAIAFIYRHAPEVAKKIKAGNKEVLKDPAVAKIPLEPILGELVAAADAEPNEVFQKNLPDVKAGKIVQVLIENFYQTNTTNIYQAPEPPKYIPTYSIPYPASTNFVGRDGVLARLADFHASQRIVAVVGMAGVGKTELAVQYAHKYGRNYGGGCYWLGMRDRVLADLLTQHVLREFGLDLPPEITDKREMAQWCWAQWERNLSTDSRVMLVLDNVDEVSQIGGMLPSDGRFRLLVTTRTQGLDATIVEERVEELINAAALEFLRKLIGNRRVDKELEQAQKLCGDLLGNLPLGIELVGRYLHQDDLTIADFTADLSKVQEELDGKDPVAVYPMMNAQRGVKSALELSWQKLAPETQTVGKLLGLCAPKAIPWELATKMAESALVAEVELPTTPNTTSSWRQLGKNLGNLWKRKPKPAPTPPPAKKILTVKESRQQLAKLSLIKWDKESETATLHALVRKFLQERGQNSDILTQIFAETMLQRARQASHGMTLAQLAKMRAIVPHIEEVALHYSQRLSDDDLLWPFIGAARFYDSQGLYLAALPWYEMCLEKAEQRLGANHPSTARSLNDLALLYRLIGNYTAALPLFKRALQIYEEKLGANDRNTAANLNNLGGLYVLLGNYTAALPLLERALQICEEKLGVNHLDTAVSLNGLAVFYRLIGNYTAALPLLERALQINQETLGANHPNTATSLNNLAELYRLIGNYTAALPLYQRALQIRGDQLGSNHPDTATSLNHLAYFYYSIGNYTAALPLFERALQIRKEQLGVNHPDTLTSLNNLAYFYYSIGNYTDALPLYQRALQIREDQLGANHPDTATSLNNLAALYRLMGNYTDALPLYQRALQICEEQLGANHPDTATSLNNLAELYRSIGNYTAALPLYERALQIREEQLGANHPHTATSLNNLAALYRLMGNYTDALPLFERALQIREDQLGANHPDTASSLNSLAVLYNSIDRSEEALPMYARAVEICEHALGLEHPSTVTVRGNYERCLGSQTDDRSNR